jgi:hypothetical protein
VRTPTSTSLGSTERASTGTGEPRPCHSALKATAPSTLWPPPKPVTTAPRQGLGGRRLARGRRVRSPLPIGRYRWAWVRTPARRPHECPLWRNQTTIPWRPANRGSSHRHAANREVGSVDRYRQCMSGWYTTHADHNRAHERDLAAGGLRLAGTGYRVPASTHTAWAPGLRGPPSHRSLPAPPKPTSAAARSPAGQRRSATREPLTEDDQSHRDALPVTLDADATVKSPQITDW